MNLTMRHDEANHHVVQLLKKSEHPIDAVMKHIGETIYFTIREDGTPTGISVRLNPDGTWTASFNTVVARKAA